MRIFEPSPFAWGLQDPNTGITPPGNGIGDRFVTPDGCYYGIAIGPESLDALVRVNGVLLQAGRWLPMRAKTYEVTRVIARDGSGLNSDGATSLTRLQLMCAESPDELSTCPARPRYVRAFYNVIATGAFQSFGILPFQGRKRATISCSTTSGGVDIAVTGRRWDRCEVNPPVSVDTQLVRTGVIASGKTVVIDAASYGEFDELYVDVQGTAAAVLSFVFSADGESWL